MILFAGNVKVASLRSKSPMEFGRDPTTMNGEKGKEREKEEWFKLCEQASLEQDPEKLLMLTREICRLLDEREKALKQARSSSS